MTRLALVTFSLIAVVVSATANNIGKRKVDEEDSLRLNRIEVMLETVLKKNEELAKKNEELEKRISKLEKERKEDLGLDTKHEHSKDVENLQEDAADQHMLNDVEMERDSDIRMVPVKRQLQEATIAFTARLTPPTVSNLGAGQTIVFDAATTNIGGAYHTTTGVFTAPVSGVYVFNYAVMLEPGKDEYIDLVKNGVRIMVMYPHATGMSNFVTVSKTATVSLKRGDEVWVKTGAMSWHGTGVIHGNDFTTFSGWLNAITE